jgi:hypothetical protein
LGWRYKLWQSLIYFFNFRKAIHADEDAPFRCVMRQAYQGFHRDFYVESGLVEVDADKSLEFNRLCDLLGSGATRLGKVRDDFEEAYCGEWDSQEDFDSHIFNAYLSSSLNISIMTT